uniref:Uncharacterized protein n=1 Tax=Triticum urartu TaxID=4572 RepID=A0A8R7PXQ4_TRIUA
MNQVFISLSLPCPEGLTVSSEFSSAGGGSVRDRQNNGGGKGTGQGCTSSTIFT